MSQYPTYSSYVATDCDWFPKIPEHWILDRAKWAVKSCQNGVWGYEPDGDDDLVCIRVADFDRQSLNITTTNLTMRSIPSKDRNNRLLKSGDLLLEKSGGGDQQLVGAVVEYNQEFPAVSSNFVARMEVNDNTDSRFIVYVHAHLYSGRVNYRAIKQTTGIQNLDSSAYLNEKIAYPPLEEQKVIAKFLDHKTAQIDALIAKKQSLLNKLAEQRTALISQAVTKGLDPSLATKESGAAWLGKIPAHWSTSRVKFVAKVGNGSTPSRDNPDYWFDGDFPWLNSSVVNREVVDSADQFVTGVALKECHLPIIDPPAVLVGITGQGKTRGMSSKLTFRATINQHLVYVKPYADSINVDYLHHIFERAYAYLRNESDAGGSTKGAITCTQIENLEIPLPPLAEQEHIVRFVDEDYSRISQLKKKVESALQRLQEYRSALITSAVTGKIDVRNYMSSVNATHSEAMR